MIRVAPDPFSATSAASEAPEAIVESFSNIGSSKLFSLYPCATAYFA
jgi:hypothetical protein